MPKSMEERLAALTTQFQTAKATYDQRFGGIKIDEGEYIGGLLRCELTTRKSDDSTCLSVEYRIMGGKFDGFTAFEQMNLDNEWGRVFAIRFLEVAGYKFPEQSDPQFVKKIMATIAAIAKEAKQFKIALSYNTGGFLNVLPKEAIAAPITNTTPAAVATPAPAQAGARARRAAAPVVETPPPPPPVVSTPIQAAHTAPAGSVKIPDFSKLDRMALKKFIRDNGVDIRVTAKLTDDDIRTALVKLFPAEEAATASTEGGVPSDEELKQALLVLCAAQGIKEVKAEMDLDAMIEIVEGYDLARDELEDDQIELLTMLQLTNCIK